MWSRASAPPPERDGLSHGVVGSHDCVVQQPDVGHRSDAAGNRGDGACPGHDLAEIDIADDADSPGLLVAQWIDPDVEHDGAFTDVFGLDETWDTGCDDEHVGASGVR